MFDLHSVIERKNPMGVIEAFRTAFAPGSGASLVIKCINRESKPDEYDRLRLAARGHPDVHIIDRYVSAQEKDAMLAASDCYVSLHRSEGFGLTPAEAMYLGKPVIATGYSGNLEYMTPRTATSWTTVLKPIGSRNFPYPADGEWANPDTDHAARLMREVVEDPLAAARRGRQAAADMRAGYSPGVAGETHGAPPRRRPPPCWRRTSSAAPGLLRPRRRAAWTHSGSSSHGALFPVRAGGRGGSRSAPPCG